MISKISKTFNIVYDFKQYKDVIRIEAKVKDAQNKVLWYIDENLNRYTTDDLIKLINSNDIIINMYLRNKVPTSFSGSIKSFYKSDYIVVIMEDSKGGYRLYKWFLETCFPLVNFICISSFGNSKLLSTV